MGEKTRGTIERITIDISYPDGEFYQRVIKADELRRLALLAFTPAAIREYLGNLKDHERITRNFEQGFEEPDRGKPSMLAVYSDGTYSEECDPGSHKPPD